MHRITLVLLVGLVFSLHLVLVVGQEESSGSLWDEALMAICGNSTNTSCLDAEMGEMFSSLTRLYNPDGGFSNISYLDHHVYEPAASIDLNSTVNKINISAAEYSAAEINIIKAFPSKLVHH